MRLIASFTEPPNKKPALGGLNGKGYPFAAAFSRRPGSGTSSGMRRTILCAAFIVRAIYAVKLFFRPPSYTPIGVYFTLGST